MAPPSFIQEHNFSYTWIRPLVELAKLPVLLPEQLHVDLAISFNRETTVSTGRTVHTQTTVSTVRGVYADPADEQCISPALEAEITEAVESYPVMGAGQTNKARFALARRLRRLAKKHNIALTKNQVGEIAGRWFDAYSHNMGNPDWPEVYVKFLHAYETVKYVEGSCVRSEAERRVDAEGAEHTVPPQRLQVISSLVDKHKKIAGQYIPLEFRLYDRHEPIKAATHVDRTTVKVDLGASHCWQATMHHRVAAKLSPNSIRWNAQF